VLNGHTYILLRSNHSHHHGGSYMTETASMSRSIQVVKDILYRHLIHLVGFLAVSIFLIIVTSIKLSDLAQEHLYKQSKLSNATMVERTRQLECLALNIYREAGYEPFEGKVGVAQVTLNRVASPDFPNDICQVVYQKNVVYQRVICQFSWYCDQVHRNRPINPRAYNESMEVAKAVLLEGFRLPGLTEALFYHADYVSPRWNNMEVLAKIGAHIFYRKRERQA